MKKKDLLAALADVDDEAEVILQKDSEGNGYSPLSGVDSNCVYVPLTEWCGDVYSLGWTATEAGMSQKDWTALKKCQKSLQCIVLYPVN